MRISYVLMAAAAVGVMLGGVTGADAKGKAKDTVTVRGCTKFVPPVCTVIGSRKTTYVLHSAMPPLPMNTGVTVKGKVTGKVGICAGTQVMVLSWKPNRLHCPK